MDLNDEDIDWLMESSALVETIPSNTEEISENRDLSTFLKILRNSLRLEPQLDDDEAFGILDSEEDFTLFLRRLKAFGYSFAVRTSRNRKDGAKKVQLNGPQFVTDKHPYVIDKVVRLYCSSGTRSEPEEEEISKCRRQPSCQARMAVRHVTLYDSYVLSEDKHLQLEMLKKLKKSIARGTFSAKQELWISVSLPSIHQHPLNARFPAIDTEVKAAMMRLLSEKAMTAKEIREKLRLLVNKEFSKDPVKPVPENRAFYPSEKVIYNALRNEGLLKRKRTIKPSVVSLRKRCLKNFRDIIEKFEDCEDLESMEKIRDLSEQILGLLPDNEQEYVIVKERSPQPEQTDSSRAEVAVISH